MNKANLVLLLLFLFSFAFVSAVPPVQTNTIVDKGIDIEAPMFDTIKANETFKFHIHAYNSTDGLALFNDTTDCIIHLYNNDGSHIIEDYMGFDSNGIDFKYDVLGGNLSGIGEYSVLFQCNNSDIGGFLEYGFDVTASGMDLTLEKAYIEITLLLFFIGLLIGFHLLTQKIDFNKWNNKIINRYENKNFIKMTFSALVFNIMKNKFIIYYLIGFPIMLVVTALSFAYNINTLFALMKVLMYIYAWGFILVGLAFLGYVQEWAMEMLERVRDIDWGIDNGK